MTGTARGSWHLQRGGLRRALAVALLLALGAALLPAAPARAQTVTWTGNAGSYWSMGGNWSTGSPPTTGDDVVLTGGLASIYDLGSSRGSNPALRSITVSPSSGS